MAALALQKIGPGILEASMSREDTLARYRHLRGISENHQSELLANHLAHDALLQNARRMGLAVGKSLILDDIDELILVLDLAIHTRLLGRFTPIERYSRLAGFAPESDEAHVLEAMRQSRFSVFRIDRRHETAGLILEDVLHDFELWLMDEDLEIAIPDGAVMAARLYATQPFFMTTGAGVPIYPDMRDDILVELDRLRYNAPRQGSNDRRFVEAIYRIAIAHRFPERIEYRDPVPEAG